MVALELDQGPLASTMPCTGPSDERIARLNGEAFIAVLNDHGEAIAFVPEEMGAASAQAHAALIAEADHLRDLACYAAEEITPGSHPGLLRAFRGYCRTVLDRIDDAILID